MEKFKMSKQFTHEMKMNTLPSFSSIDIQFVKDYLYVDYEDDDLLIITLIESAKELVSSFSEVAPEELDKVKIASVLVMMIVSDLYNNRSTTATDVKIKFSPLFIEMKNTLRGKANGYNL